MSIPFVHYTLISKAIDLCSFNTLIIALFMFLSQSSDKPRSSFNKIEKRESKFYV